MNKNKKQKIMNQMTIFTLQALVWKKDGDSLTYLFVFICFILETNRIM